MCFGAQKQNFQEEMGAVTNTQTNYATSCICLQVLLALNVPLRKHSLEKIKNIILPQEICTIPGLIMLYSIATWI